MPDSDVQITVENRDYHQLSQSATKTGRGGEVEKELTCSICGWEGNQNREDPRDFAGLLEDLSRRVERAHLHFMRHMFWNRFPYSRWFTPQLSAAEKESYFGRRDWLKKIEEEPISYVIEHVAQIEFEPLTTKTISLPLTRRTE